MSTVWELLARNSYLNPSINSTPTISPGTRRKVLEGGTCAQSPPGEPKEICAMLHQRPVINLERRAWDFRDMVD